MQRKLALDDMLKAIQLTVQEGWPQGYQSEFRDVDIIHLIK
jgi:hypothetical protein